MRKSTRCFFAWMSGLGLILTLLVGSVLAAEMPDGWPWRGVTSDIDAIRKHPEIIDFFGNEDIRFVRLHINVFNLMSDHHLSAEKALDFALRASKEVARNLADKNIKSIVSIADFPVDKHQCIYKTKVSYWDKNGKCIQQIYKFVNKTVDLMSESEIVGYEFLSEPVVKKKVSRFPQRYSQPDNWLEIFKEILNIVRKKDKERYVIFSLGPWAFPDNYSSFKPFADERIIYDIHMYQPLLYAFQGIKGHKDGIYYPGVIPTREIFPTYDRFPNDYWDKKTLEEILRPARIFEEKYHVPVLVGEFGAVLWAPNSNRYLGDLLSVFQANNWGWIYFDIGSRWHGFDARFVPYKKNGKYQFRYMGRSTNRMKILREYFKKQ